MRNSTRTLRSAGERLMAGLAVLALAAGLGTGAARAERISHFKIGNWNGGAYTHSKTGAFSHCAASARYRSGTTLMFSIHDDLNWAFGLVNQRWKLKVGERYPVRFWVDRGRDYSATAEVVAEYQVKVPLPADDRLFRRVRRGRVLYVRTADTTMNFTLTSTNRMLSRLFDCATYWRNRAPANETNPFAGDNDTTNPFADEEEDTTNPFADEDEREPDAEDTGNPFAAPEETSARIVE